MYVSDHLDSHSRLDVGVQSYVPFNFAFKFAIFQGIRKNMSVICNQLGLHDLCVSE